MDKRFVIVESPFAGDVFTNVCYGWMAVYDCIERGELPFASHLFYTVCLDDNKQEDRALGIDLGFDIAKYAHTHVFYVDLGLSRGMSLAQDNLPAGKGIVRNIPDWKKKLDTHPAQYKIMRTALSLVK
jgi:hypothetical protein